MTNRTTSLNSITRSLFGGATPASAWAGITSILDEWEARHPAADLRWLAYMLGTTHHETDATMQPIEEYGKGAKLRYGRRVKMDGTPYADTQAIFYGRGYVMLTWYDNYLKAKQKLGIDSLQHPELVMVPENAAKIMFLGMTEGWFTGAKLSKYFNATTEDWVNARRIINGTDCADKVAGYAKLYYQALKEATT
jgi:hypothetical protein